MRFLSYPLLFSSNWTLSYCKNPRESTFLASDWLGICHLPIIPFPRTTFAVEGGEEEKQLTAPQVLLLHGQRGCHHSSYLSHRPTSTCAHSRTASSWNIDLYSNHSIAMTRPSTLTTINSTIDTLVPASRWPEHPSKGAQEDTCVHSVYYHHKSLFIQIWTPGINSCIALHQQVPDLLNHSRPWPITSSMCSSPPSTLRKTPRIKLSTILFRNLHGISFSSFAHSSKRVTVAVHSGCWSNTQHPRLSDADQIDLLLVVGAHSTPGA